jgi:hypothetical protein
MSGSRILILFAYKKTSIKRGSTLAFKQQYSPFESHNICKWRSSYGDSVLWSRLLIDLIPYNMSLCRFVNYETYTKQ